MADYFTLLKIQFVICTWKLIFRKVVKDNKNKNKNSFTILIYSVFR